MHVYVPLNTDVGYAATKAYARAVARLLAAADPKRVVDRMAKNQRAGRVFVDWSQNDLGKSTVAPYSLRALRVPAVSTPVTWEEVAAAVSSADPRRLAFGPAHVAARVQRDGDLFAPVLHLAQGLAQGLTQALPSGRLP
ncbi:MAG TPA: hypothetical protein VKP64_08340 [Mycobacteriales bacterium]|nr:hypothetical protein [Mycobacteriales bacterium]